MDKREFDLLVRRQSQESASSFGYPIGDVIYDVYYTKELFQSYAEGLKGIRLDGNHPNAFLAYKDGKGGELDETPGQGGGLVPPKMASVASSSRFCVEAILKAGRAEISKVFGLSEGFFLDAEHAVPFQRGGIPPQLDAYLADGDHEVFVESKCHEIFDAHSLAFRESYGRSFSMYDPDFILPPVDAKGEFRLSSALLGIEEGVTLRFDAKQAISHLLGVRKQHRKKALLLFLFFRPCDCQAYAELERQIEAFAKSPFVNGIVSGKFDVAFAYEASPKMAGLSESNYHVFCRIPKE
jgi:hypothetical protein